MEEEKSSLQQVWRNVKFPVPAACLVLSLCTSTGCNRDRDTSGQGTTGAATQSGSNRAQQTATPESAPNAQPRFNEVGVATGSRIATNALGQKGISVRERNQPIKPQHPQGATPDDALAQRVRVALSTGTTGTTGTYTPDMLMDIGVTASNGIVTLTGPVGSEDARRQIAARAQSVEGVRGVDNALVVNSNIRPGSPTPGVPAGRGQVETVPQHPETK